MLPIPFVHSRKAANAMAFETERMRLPAALRGRADRRAELFRESLGSVVQRHILGLAWALSPTRLRGVPNVIRLCFDEFLAPDYALPDAERAFDNPPGLAGIVHRDPRSGRSRERGEVVSSFFLNLCLYICPNIGLLSRRR